MTLINDTMSLGEENATFPLDLNGTNPTRPPCGEQESAPGGLDLAEYYYKLSEDLFIVFDPIIVMTGLVGAALIIAVMQRPALRVSSVSIYMTALAVSDILVLLLDFINNWLKMEAKVYLLGSSHGFCKFHRFFFNVVYTYSAWLVVSLAVEKALVVWFPFKAKTLCNRRNATLAVCLMPVPIFCLYLYNLWAWELNAEGVCDMVPSWVHFQTNIGPWISGTVYSYIPIVLLIFLNSALCYKLWEARTRRRNNLGLDKAGHMDDKVERRVTITVVTICVAFLLLTTPLALFYVILFLAGEFINPGPEMALGEVIILILGLSNHAVNFFLYILTSARFRTELRALFGCPVKTASAREGAKVTLPNSPYVIRPGFPTSGSATPDLRSKQTHVSSSYLEASPRTSHATESTNVSASGSPATASEASHKQEV